MKSQVLTQKYNSLSRPWLNISKLITSIFLIVSVPIFAHAAQVSDFIPKDSHIYAQLNDIDEVYNEILTSESWEKILDPLKNELDLQEIQQGLLVAQTALGIDLSGLIKTFGYQTGLTFWSLEAENVQAGLVVHSGGNLPELQRLAKIFIGFVGMGEGTLKLDAGKHRKVKYNTLQLPDVLLTYGFVGDCLVVGIGENSFEKLIDTYRKKIPSIRKNVSYSEASKKQDSGQVTLYIDVPKVLPLIEDMDATTRAQFETFSKIIGKLNVLEVGPMLQLYTQFNPNLSDSALSLFLQEGDKLETLKSLSGKEDLFIACSPSILETVWQLAQNEIENTETDDVYAFITFLEGILNLNFKEDIIAGLTGEIALSVDDLTLFEPDELENLDIQIEDTFSIDAANTHTQGGLIFIPSNSRKWEQIGNSLSNLQNTSMSHTDYKGTKVSIFASNIHYAEKDGLSLLSFSDDQIFSIVDGLQNKKKLRYLKQLPKTPLAVVKLNMVKLLELINGPIPMDNFIEMPDEISPLLAWITVKEDEVMLEASLSEKDSPLEVLAKLAPFIISNLDY